MAGQKTLSYDPKRVVGDVFEAKVATIFDLKRVDSRQIGRNPDLVSKDGKFSVEVKAGGKDNCAVIRGNQIIRFNDDTTNTRRFYALAYHAVEGIEKRGISKKQLRRELQLIALYLFPFSVVWAHYQHSPKKLYSDNDDYVPLKRIEAQKIFEGNLVSWSRLGIDYSLYQTIIPHRKIFIMTKQGNLEKEILASLNPRRI